jgi:flagellar protein FlbD
MIRLTHLDQREFALNCDLIESIEARPDTTLKLVTGQSQVVRESVDEVLERIVAWRASALVRAGVGALVGAVPAPVRLARANEPEREDEFDGEAAA